jgi:predicted metalloprotease with PDZ domain
LQLRDSLLTLEQYLQVLQGKFGANDNFDQNLSLTSLGVHSTELQSQYGNIYSKGALVSALLDIRLLELSHGKSGLRELFLQLSKEYGKKRAFSEDGFFDKIVSMTYPEIGDFINRYIKGTDKLPAKEYFGWLGIDYKEQGDPDTTKSSLRIGLRGTMAGFVVEKVYGDSRSGLMKDDTLKTVDGDTLSFVNMQQVMGKMSAMKNGSTLKITVKRGDKDVDVNALLLPRIGRHLFIVNPNPTPEELALRNAWMRNM